ncbi:ABC transporter permease/substrate-binding protein [Lachnoclostridium sp. An181]|uniref:ABC transporter permease/substrate-binding protein n=1 Tax=Lachnoclostridium sp. An181 TaxID=1965575 RepID=UPI000B3A252E|nr:glycine betaine ABC transporter substrate-binding protein [Lachnoclostridium sp. An181]OUP48719.1 glycine/betaine ABC transporter substrate-binding protein [Lachnoclostridium sp. An181]
MVSEVWTLLCERREFFWNLCVQHLVISAAAVGMAIVFGGIIGIIAGEMRRSSKPIVGIVNFLYTIPSISMLGFFIPVFGIGNTTAVITLTLYALLPMVRSTYTGLKNVDEHLIEAAKGMGSTKFQILYKVKLPLALPVMMSGIRNMVVMTLALAGIASFIGAGGLGVAIYRGITTNNMAMTVAGSLLIALLALLLDWVIGVLEKWRGKRKKKGRKKLIIAGIMILAAGIGGSFLWNEGNKTEIVHIATKPMTEQYIMGEMLDILIEDSTDLQVEITQGVGGGTSNIQPAMESGDFDIYPEYTGTAWNMVLKKEDLYTEEKQGELRRAYQEKYDMEWLGMYGFSNSYALAVRKDLAETYDLHTISDLKEIAPSLTFGAEYDFYEREDGYEPLCETYGLQFKNTVDLDIGLKYEAAGQKEIDVMPIFTTDGQYSVSDMVALEDDLHFYPSYACGNIVRGEVLRKHPELQQILGKLDEILTNKEMARLNYEVETEGKEPRQAAEEFLRKKGLIL